MYCMNTVVLYSDFARFALLLHASCYSITVPSKVRGPKLSYPFVFFDIIRPGDIFTSLLITYWVVEINSVSQKIPL